MLVSATEFKAKCSNYLDKVEHEHETLEITRHGEIIARVVAVENGSTPHPWTALRGKGRFLATPNESVLSMEDFDASR